MLHEIHNLKPATRKVHWTYCKWQCFYDVWVFFAPLMKQTEALIKVIEIQNLYCLVFDGVHGGYHATIQSIRMGQTPTTETVNVSSISPWSLQKQSIYQASVLDPYTNSRCVKHQSLILTETVDVSSISPRSLQKQSMYQASVLDPYRNSRCIKHQSLILTETVDVSSTSPWSLQKQSMYQAPVLDPYINSRCVKHQSLILTETVDVSSISPWSLQKQSMYQASVLDPCPTKIEKDWHVVLLCLC